MASAQKLTNLIKQIIEFAKMVPGFMKLNQDDQIVLLKKGKRSGGCQTIPYVALYIPICGQVQLS
jgi:hypothetical protein